MLELSSEEIEYVSGAGFFHDAGKLLGRATAYFFVTRDYSKQPMRPEEFNSITMG